LLVEDYNRNNNMLEIEGNSTLRILRVLYPIWILLGLFSLIYIPSIIIELGDPTITSKNIAANLFLFRLGIIGSLLIQLLFIIIPFQLYQLLKKVDKGSALIMVILAYISIPITIYNETNKLRVIEVLDTPNQVISLLETFNHGMILSTIFWGLWLFPLGWLIYKSSFFPKLIGIGLFIGGAGYLLGSFFKILLPEIKSIQNVFEIMTFGELLFILWLIIKGKRKI